MLIVQADAFNQSRIRTVMVAPLSGSIRLADAPGNVLLEARKSGLSKESVVNVSQVLTIDKSFLLQPVRTLPESLMRDVDSGLRLASSL